MIWAYVVMGVIGIGAVILGAAIIAGSFIRKGRGGDE